MSHQPETIALDSGPQDGVPLLCHHGATKIPSTVPHLLDGEGYISVLVGRFGAMLDELVPHL